MSTSGVAGLAASRASCRAWHGSAPGFCRRILDGVMTAHGTTVKAKNFEHVALLVLAAMSTTTTRLCALAAALLCCALLASSASAFTVSVGAGAIECFMDDVKTGEKVLGGFNVLSGGQLDIDVKVLDPQNKAVYAENKEMSGTFTFVASQTGLYFICFSNQMSSYTTKIVNFHMHVGSTLGAHQVAKKDHLTGLETSVLTLSEGMTFLKDEMDYLKTRERLHRDSASSRTALIHFCAFFISRFHLEIRLGFTRSGHGNGHL